MNFNFEDYFRNGSEACIRTPVQPLCIQPRPSDVCVSVKLVVINLDVGLLPVQPIYKPMLT